MEAAEWDTGLEGTLIGCLLLNPDLLPAVAVAAADFTKPNHRTIFAALEREQAAGHPVSPLSISYAACPPGARHSRGGEQEPYLTWLADNATGSAADALACAAEIAEAARRRQLAATGQRIIQAAPSRPVSEVLGHVQADLDRLAAASVGPAATSLDISAFIDAGDADGDVLIPGMLDRRERLMVVAPEGAGKSTLGTQVAVMAAAGLHPLTGKPIDARLRTIVLDLENAPALVRKRAAYMAGEAARQPDWNPALCHLWCQPGGVDIRSHADRQVLASLIGGHGADLVVIGPAYKLVSEGSEKPEQVAGYVTDFIDSLRAKFDCAWWIEAHAPLPVAGQRDMRPIGSSRWLRWPEYGWSLTASADPKHPEGTLKLSTFRGNRQYRQWPRWLVRSRGGWPWRAVWADGTIS